MLRRINFFLLLPSIALILLSLGGWSYIASHQQQINSYISSQLTNQLGTSVTLDTATLGFHPAPTIDFEQIKLVDKKNNLHCDIPQLHVGLSWQDLFRGKLICAKLTLVKPDITWHHPDSKSTSNKPQSDQKKQKSPGKLNTPGIGTLLRQAKIEDGTFHFSGITPWKAQKQTIHNLDVHLHTTSNKQLDIKVSGNLRQQGKADAQISLNALIQDISSNWLDAPINVQCKINKLHATNMLPQQYKLDGDYNISMNLSGQRNSKLHLQATATAVHAGQQLHISNRPSVPFNFMEIDSQFRWDNDQLLADKIILRYNDLQIDTTVQLTNWKTKPQIYVNAHSNTVQAEKFLAWLPKQWRAKIPAKLLKLGQQSQLQCQNLVLNCPAAIADKIDSSTIQTAIKDAQFTITHPGLDYPPIRANNFTAKLSWDGLRGKLSTSTIQFKNNSSSINGPLEIDLLPKPDGSWQTSANLTPVAINLAQLFNKPTGSAGNFSININYRANKSNVQQNGWRFSNGELTLPGYHLLFNGNYRSTNDYQLKLQLPNYQLATISAKIPLLKHMQLKGTVHGQYQIKKQADTVATGRGNIILDNCAITPTDVIAPIHHINGMVKLDNFSASATGLTIKLGNSNMQVDANIADLRHTVAELHAHGDKVIAKDLVFNNPAIMLYNLDGRINIHAKGIDFIDASVNLAQGTHANVAGKLHFNKLALNLSIDSPNANINEVIALWSRDDRTDSAESAPTKISTNHEEFIHINTHVAQGVINGFTFQNATGTIHYKRGQLRIEPLRFIADNGYGKGAIFIINKPLGAKNSKVKEKSYSLLKICGELNDINADKVYRQLLSHNGIVTGKLNGDFTIQGPTGSNFLPNSNGNFHLQIRHGVLREFKFISKAFSLLNVAQLFAFNLPDMAVEGMPFTQLTGDIRLNKGVLYSDNLVIDSPAMGLTIVGDHNLNNNQLNLIMGIKPLGTVDTVVNNIPVAGWILTGNNKALISTNFKIHGSALNPEVSMLPFSSLGKKLFGILERTVTLPQKLYKTPIKILTNITD
ncbi:MAG: hypothetical protein B6I36_03320 [Desulfobacteraceae bacterium 4572_35.1]|nr:MAG: hypothetical protein B6I36_03320 [Desulfobacteraceae bacterium 4572_35.1]